MACALTALSAGELVAEMPKGFNNTCPVKIRGGRLFTMTVENHANQLRVLREQELCVECGIPHCRRHGAIYRDSLICETCGDDIFPGMRISSKHGTLRCSSCSILQMMIDPEDWQEA